MLKSSPHLAWIDCQWVANQPLDLPTGGRFSPAPQRLVCQAAAAHSAVARLVGAVYEAFPGQAHRVLRNRLFTTALENEIDRALVQVAAGKITFGASAPDSGAPLTWLDEAADGLNPTYNEFASLPFDSLPCDLPELAHALEVNVLSLPRDPAVKRAEQDRPIAAALVDPTGTPRLAARNTAGRNKTRHAEINLLSLAETAGLLPLHAGWRIVVTLSPCRMCAARIVSAYKESNDASVLFLHHDPGRLAQNTALHRNGLLLSLS